jgi:glutamate-1-semialdehyde 2,1-aminomutase
MSIMPRRSAKSKAAFERASKVLVGGVNSPVRAFTAVGGAPPFIASASGSTVTDIDNNTYIDYVGGYGPMILGHACEPVVSAITKAIHHGTCYGAPTELETQLAEAIVAAMPSVQKVRFVSSGTEAAMTALRLARGATGRPMVVKFAGCYHGHCDSLLVQAGSGATTLGVPSSPGVPAGVTADTLLARYNDVDSVAVLLEAHRGQVAAVLVEPVAGNMGVVPPVDGFLPGLRDLCDGHGALLIFDEVMTGFRVALGGAKERYGVRADVTLLGKIIGGGLPVGAVGGPAHLMDQLAPAGPIYQAGTLSGNPAAMAAGLATLQELHQDGLYERLEVHSARLEQGLAQAAQQAGLAGQVCINRVASMLTCFFTAGPVRDYAGATAGNTRAFAAYFQAMLQRGAYLAPSQFEAMFVSAAHSQADIDMTVAAAREAMAGAAALMKSSVGRR